MKNFHAITLSYKLCPIAYREVFSFNKERISRLLNAIQSIVKTEDLFIISTCNRTEIYYTSKIELDEPILRLVGLEAGMVSNKYFNFFISLKGKAAIRHLYHVALGLDSMLVGDMQIINQVKQSYQQAADLGMIGTFGHRLLHSIFNTNKRVNQETKFREGNSSLASAAVSRAKEFATQFHHPKIVVVGLGEIGSTVSENLKKIKGSVTLINRTLHKAEELANKYNFSYGSIQDLDNHISNADIIISAVRCEKPIINSENLIPKDVRHQLMIDLSVPRSIGEDMSKVNGIHIINIDELVQQTKETKLLRESKIIEVNQLIEEAIAELKDWNKKNQFSPVIKQFKAALEEIRKQEVSRYLGKLEDSNELVIENMTKNIIQKIIKLPVLQLKNKSEVYESEKLTDSLKTLFDLDNTSIQI
mgnify:CR=1 FL=1|tara:strand:+ start:1675 stop:2928 length:1254 start_codon:yes stop_codon:yes gene_type:complete